MRIDYNKLFFFVAVLFLFFIGILAQINIKSVMPEEAKNLLFGKISIIAFIAFIVIIICANINLNFFKKTLIPLYIISILLLIACFIPGLGVKINGAARWIGFDIIGIYEKIQPSEFARIILIISLAAWFTKIGKKNQSFLKGFFLPTIIVSIPTFLILIQIDLSMTILICSILFIIFIIAGVKLKYITAATIISLVLVTIIIFTQGNRAERISAIFNIKSKSSGVGLQQYRSQNALKQGKLFGIGLGKSQFAKKIYSSESDFILAIIGNELGLMATFSILICYFIIFLFSISIYKKNDDKFIRLLTIGISSSILAQAFIHIGVNTLLLPNTGMPLPLVSSGGSNLIVNAACIGLLLNAYQLSKKTQLIQKSQLTRLKITPANL